LARAQAGGGLDWVAAGSAWQAERMTISLSSVGAERIPAWLEQSRARPEIGGGDKSAHEGVR
jgi:hypothetical protein